MKHTFRFSIRELLLVMLVIGLSLGWWLDRKLGSAQFEKADARAYVLEEMLFEVGFDIEWVGDRVKATSDGYKFDWPVDKSPKAFSRQRLLPPKPCPMKYSLRSLMVVMLMAAIFAAWWADHRRLVEENGRLAKEVKGHIRESAVADVSQ